MKLETLTASQAAKLLESKEVSSVELTQACLERIELRNGEVGAFAHIDPEFSLKQAALADSEPRRSSFQGVPFGVKDVIDTKDFLTERGTPIHAGRQPVADAKCVQLMREAGAVLLGKLVSTEYAMFTPNETRHPLDLTRTAGGSSSGTGAAVADNMVPLAFGNQTAGSLIRPAAYCGVYGLKPTHGTTDGAGILPLQLYFDTLGYMARSIEDLQYFYSIVSQDQQCQVWSENKRPKIGLCRTFNWSAAEKDSQAMLLKTGEQFEQLGYEVIPFELPESYSNLTAVHRRILYKGISDSLAKDYESSADKMSEGLLEVVREGQKCTEEAFMTAFRIADACRTEVNEMFGDLDAIICPSTPGEAPEGWGTGSPIFQVMWTLLGVPCLNLPVGFGPNQMPLGVQLIGRRYDDANLLALGDYLMRNFKSIQIESFSNAKS
jgi:Asp-tRNA(Asn)/Glu-tRNA(Gln) amidotransferase A subunit family amidase